MSQDQRTRQGYLLLADISGYTAFLVGTMVHHRFRLHDYGPLTRLRFLIIRPGGRRVLPVRKNTSEDPRRGRRHRVADPVSDEPRRQDLRDTARYLVVDRCPVCAFPLQTLDLPCPSCEAEDGTRSANSTFREFSKSFKTQHVFRTDTDGFVATLNSWLYEQPGLVFVSPMLHWDIQHVVRGATLTCVASLDPSPIVFQFHRLKLSSGGPFKVQRADLATALNDWSDGHPDHERVSHSVYQVAGIPMECWVLSVLPRELAQAPAEARPPRSFMGVHRSPGPILLLFGLFFLLAGLTASVGATDLIASALIAAGGGWLTYKFPPWRRRTKVPTT